MSLFSQIKLRRPKRSYHNLSYINQLSLDFGKLVPIMCEKVVPGDKFIHSHEFYMRFAPFVNQVFQSFQVRTDYFFVPSRLLWKNFEPFLSRGVNGSTDYQHPFLDLSTIYDGQTIYINTLLDYFNLATDRVGQPIDGSAANLPHIDALPFYSYIKIMLDYYFDENLYPSDIQDIDDLLNGDIFLSQDGDMTQQLMSFLAKLHHSQGDDNNDLFSIFSPMKRSYPKDYFTSALPFAQRGPIVQIPLNGSGDVHVYGTSGDYRDTYTGIGVKASQPYPGGSDEEVQVTLFQNYELGYRGPVATTNVNTTVNANQNMIVESTGLTDGQQTIDGVRQHAVSTPITFKAVNINGTATITDLRTAMTLQSWLEKNARAGVRYKEQLASHFGVKSRDYRLDRAELLGRYKNTVQIGQTFTTAANTDGTFIPGMGVSNASAAGTSQKWKRTFEEHGYIIGLLSVFPTAGYFQGIPKQFTELDVFDYYWPEFQHIGEQEINNYELFVDDEGGNNKGVFGYTPRYAHYKNRPNQVHGDFRKSLEFMHAARKFSTIPNLNNPFVNVDIQYNDLYRIFNASAGVLSENSPVYVDFYHNCKAKRPMDYFGTPRIF